MTYCKTAAARVLLLIVLAVSLAGCVVAEPGPSYAYYPAYPTYGYYYPYGYYPYGGYSTFGFSYWSGGGWGHHHWR